jgi:4-amino-4-deoxy-L-arabinose transferase-like glycosyltransferase
MAVLVLLCLALFLPGFSALPPVDRDEASFAQASRQMWATGDLIEIRMHDRPRLNKPAGIYWLQAGAVALTGGAGEGAMATYRAVSLAGAVASVLLTWRIAALFAGPAVALWAGVLMAATLVLGAEARLAKTDAVLLALTLVSQWVLGRLWMQADHAPGPVLPGWQVAAFWGALAAAVMVKGPMGPLVVGLTAVALVAVSRRAGWLLALRPGPGALLAAALVVPWYVAITLRTDGAFWAASLGRDLLAKVAEGQESKGAPPGTYLVAFWATFWPAAVVLPLAVPALWSLRRSRGVVFCLCWVLPVWIVFEAVATKLLHYTMPTYPALAILAAIGLGATQRPLGAIWRRVVVAVVLVVPVAALGALAVVSVRLGAGLPWPFLPGLAIWAGGAAALWRALAAGRPGAAVASAAALGLALAVALYPGVARIGPIWPSAAMGVVRDGFDACPDPVLVSAGYGEPSVVFTLGRGVLLTDGAGAAAALAAAPCALAFVEDRARADFEAALPGLRPEGRIEGVNLGSGKAVGLGIYARRP